MKRATKNPSNPIFFTYKETPTTKNENDPPTDMPLLSQHIEDNQDSFLIDDDSDITNEKVAEIKIEKIDKKL
jgi:hypothetical protein